MEPVEKIARREDKGDRIIGQIYEWLRNEEGHY